MIANKLKTPADNPPITLSEGKKQLNIEDDFTDDDSHIISDIKAAANYFFNRTGRQLMQATFEMVMDDWYYNRCNDVLEIPVAPVVKINSIKYYDNDNSLQTLSTNSYRLNNYHEPAHIEFIGTLPGLYDRTDAVIIEYVAGYGADGATAEAQQAAVPEEWKKPIKMLLTDFYEHRGENIVGNLGRVSKTFDILISEARVFTKVFFEYNHKY